MENFIKEEAVRAQAATGIPPNSESLIVRLFKENRRRTVSTSNFFRIFSSSCDKETSDTLPRVSIMKSKVYKTMIRVFQEIQIMEKASKEQENISRNELMKLRSLLVALQDYNEEPRRNAKAKAFIRLRTSKSNIKSLAETTKYKKTSNLPTVQVTNESGATSM